MKVLVTGATRGLGLAIATRLLREGYQVIGVARHPSEEFTELVCASNSGRGHFVAYDLGQMDGLQQLVHRLVKTHGPLYGLVNNAGLGLDGILPTMHARDIDQVLRVNLQAPIHLIKYASRSMMLRKEGRIVNISSIIARTGFSGLSVYAASKAGVNAFSQSLAIALAPHDIYVGVVAPGFVETDMAADLLASPEGDAIRAQSPLGRVAKPKEVAHAVLFLASDGAEFSTGAIIDVNGASYLRS